MKTEITELSPQMLGIYNGYEVYVPEYHNTAILSAISTYNQNNVLLTVEYPDNSVFLNDRGSIKRLKPVLRSLLSMSFEERMEFENLMKFRMCTNLEAQELVFLRVKQIKCLIEKRYDVFGLIENGKAIVK